MTRICRLGGALAVCLAVTCAAAGQTPPPGPNPNPTPMPALAITGPAAVPLYTLGQYAVSGDPAAKVAWLVMPNTSQVVSGQSLVMTGPSGNYTVIAFAVANGQPVILQQVVTIGTSPGPTPGPTPTPTPPPTPTPVPAPTTGPYWIGFVTDRSGNLPLTAGQAALQNSTTITGSLKALAFGNQWSPIVDVSSPTLAPWASAVRAAGLPCILVLGTDANGAGVKIEAFPAVDEASTLAEIRRLAAGGAPKTSMHRAQPKPSLFSLGTEEDLQFFARTAFSGRAR